MEPVCLFVCLPKVFIPPMRKGLDKTLVVPIFGAKECIKLQEFVLKIYKKIPGSRPRTPAPGGETFVRIHPVPTRRMLVPSASSRLATALLATVKG